MPEACFPEQFQDLEPWADWSLATEAERSAKRQASSMSDIQAFYTVLLARADDVFAYLDRFSVEELPPAARRLFHLTLALAEVAPAVEQFGQPSVVDGYDIKRVTATQI